MQALSGRVRGGLQRSHCTLQTRLLRQLAHSAPCFWQRRTSRSALAAAAAADAPRDDGPSTSATRSNVERASKLLDLMVEEILRELFVEEAAAYVGDEPALLSEAEAVRNCVAQHIEQLDANFLAALNGFIQAASGPSGEPQLAALLAMMRDEVLSQVTMRLPGPAVVLSAALKEVDKDARVEMLRAASNGGNRDLPGVTLDELAASAGQLIDDMEDQQVVADRRLLARLVMLREEVGWLGAERGYTQAGLQQPGPEQPGGDNISALSYTRSNVPQRCAIFLKELVVTNDPSQRTAVLSRALVQDWDSAAPRQKPQSAVQRGQPDFVRPGRFMATLHTMDRQLREAGEQGNAQVLKRLADIQLEAMAVLDRIQRGQLVPSAPSSSSSSEAAQK